MQTVAPIAPSPSVPAALHLPLEALRPSTQPAQVLRRKRFSDDDLQELSQSITSHGVLQPILVRPLPQGHLIARHAALEPTHEIVAGERRWRASKLAGMATIPVLSRELSDLEVVELQLVENLQRSDLTELEEAESYRSLLRKPDGLQGYATADDIAAKIGKSRRHVFNRLKLLDLQEPGRQALLEGKVSASVALLIARLHTPEDQAKALNHVRKGWGGEPLSYREAADWIHREFFLELDRAIFQITDTALLPEAGSCRDCPKRTGANPDLFDDVKKADKCTDSACYHAKEAAHRARLKAQAEAKGMQIITGAEAKKAAPHAYGHLKGYLELDKVHSQLHASKTLRKLLGKKLPEISVLEHPHTKTLVEVVRESDAIALLKEAGVIQQKRLPGGDAAQRDAERKAKAEVKWRQAVAQACVDAAGVAGIDVRPALLTEAAIVLWGRLDYDATKRAQQLMGWPLAAGNRLLDNHEAEKRIRELDDAGFARLLVASTLAGQAHTNQYNTGKPVRVLALAQLLGVDHKAIRDEQRDLQRVRTGKAAAKKAAAPVTPETALASALAEAKETPPRQKRPGGNRRASVPKPQALISDAAANPFRASV